MWPWGHLGVGYLLYSLSRRARGRGPPTDAGALALAIGTQSPDLVDKPLAWWVGVLPSGRSLAHSVLFGSVVVGLVWWVAWRRGSHVGPAFALGYASHLLADASMDVVDGSTAQIRFLVWPLLGTPNYHTENLFQLVEEFSLSPTIALGIVVALFTVAVWAVDGFPGLGGVGRLYRHVRRMES